MKLTKEGLFIPRDQIRYINPHMSVGTQGVDTIELDRGSINIGDNDIFAILDDKIIVATFNVDTENEAYTAIDSGGNVIKNDVIDNASDVSFLFNNGPLVVVSNGRTLLIDQDLNIVKAFPSENCHIAKIVGKPFATIDSYVAGIYSKNTETELHKFKVYHKDGEKNIAIPFAEAKEAKSKGLDFLRITENLEYEFINSEESNENDDLEFNSFFAYYNNHTDAFED